MSKVVQGKQIVSSLALPIGLILSPASLALLGNKMGQAGGVFLFAIAIGAAIHFLTVYSYGKLSHISHSFHIEMHCIHKALGLVPCLVLSFCSRGVFLVSAAPVILAMAGYVFNEVFLYWFPNLAFSFCCLFFLLALNLLGREVAEIGQICFVLTAFLGLTVLSLVGLTGSGIMGEMEGVYLPLRNMIQILLPGVLLLVGFELPILTNREWKRRPSIIGVMILAIIMTGSLFSVWGLNSIRYVTLARLSETTVPHMVTARAMLGDGGRILMGIVVLASACGVVNALLITVSSMISYMAMDGFLPSFLGMKWNRPIIPLFLLTACIAAMMGYGMAGEPVLEVYIRAALFFWLLLYGVIHLSVLLLQKRAHTLSIVPWIGIFTMFAALIGVVWYDQERIILLKAIFFIFMAAVLFALVWDWAKRRSQAV